ncbi:MAG: FAD-dependent oxidoreductase [Patescibacteria group bacterium]|jgi:alkyl hydroperoxide reductase subunit F|nr:FAD-dependent oxidoreductase [Patescibacteria group bacterium]
MLYDVIIIGAGPAGVAATVYVARKKLKVLLITDSFGGQSIVSDDIQNWIGEKSISGFDLAKKLEDHVKNFNKEIEIKEGRQAVGIKKINCPDGLYECNFEVTTDQNNKYISKTLILASGARRRKLGVKGEQEFEGRGVAYCSTCDAPLFNGRDVAVVGGGNSGGEAVVDLLPYTNKIYLLNRSDILKADLVTQDQIRNNKKVSLIMNAEILEILGDQFVSGLKYKDNKTGEEKQIEVQGVFVEIGSIPNSEIVKDLVELDRFGQVVIDSKHATTSQPGIFAAGDITDDPYKQNNISAGDGVKAALAAYAYILQLHK